MTSFQEVMIQFQRKFLKEELWRKICVKIKTIGHNCFFIFLPGCPELFLFCCSIMSENIFFAFSFSSLAECFCFSYFCCSVLGDFFCFFIFLPDRAFFPFLLAPKVLLEDLWPMIIIPSISIPSVRHIALNELNRPKIVLSQPSMT